MSESGNHKQIKEAIYSDLLASGDCIAPKREACLGAVIPDILVTIKGYFVAVEIQLSQTNERAMLEKLNVYKRIGVYSIWVFNSGPSAGTNIISGDYRLFKWQMYLQRLYFGKVFRWIDEGATLEQWTVKRSHLARYERSGYVETGRYAKTLIDIKGVSKVNIIQDFYPVRREPYNDLPEALLWTTKR